MQELVKTAWTKTGKSSSGSGVITSVQNQQKMDYILEGLTGLQLNFGGAVSVSEKLSLEAFQLKSGRL